MRAVSCVRALLVLCCSLVLTTSASAECAWILWQENVYRPNKATALDARWARIKAFDSSADCRTKMDERFSSF